MNQWERGVKLGFRDMLIVGLLCSVAHFLTMGLSVIALTVAWFGWGPAVMSGALILLIVAILWIVPLASIGALGGYILERFYERIASPLSTRTAILSGFLIGLLLALMIYLVLVPLLKHFLPPTEFVDWRWGFAPIATTFIFSFSRISWILNKTTGMAGMQSVS